MARCRILLAIGEGEFAGGLDATRIFLDGTPLGNDDGTMNFENVEWDFRPGTQTQEHIPGFPAVENEINVGVDLKHSDPWVRAISNTQLDAVVVRMGIPGLERQEDDGDVVGEAVRYVIDISTDGAAYQTVLDKTVTEKLSTLYEISHRINLPKANFGWQVRVSRVTPDSTSQLLQNKTQIQALTEVIDARLRYPHTALLYVSFNAKSFSNIPKISCKPKGRIIRIPQNYDPIARTYTGSWDGTFKWGWTNNPAWIWFDVLTEPRFGLGRRVTADMLDKWELYRIAQRCDQLVPDGKGGDGKEPRFIFDVYIQAQSDAWQVIKDIAAGFCAMTFWGNNMFNVVSDMPADESKLQILTRASVVGKPTYSSGSEKTRFSSALINFSDPDNHYQDRTTAVMFPELVKQFKFKQTQITAIGCTRESEAQRRGGWAVYSNYLDRIISVKTGLDGYTFIPGTVFAFADERLSGRVYGGRVVGYDEHLAAVTTDRGTSAEAGDTLMIRTLGGVVESRTIQAVNGTQLVLNQPFSSPPASDAVFVIDAGQLRLQYFRVTKLTYDDEENTFTITGAEYNSSKYDAVDNNARLDTPPLSLIPTGVVSQPRNITITSYDAVQQGQRSATLVASWDAPIDKAGKTQADIVAYQAQWKRDDNEWINLPETGLRNVEVSGIFAGGYMVRVRAINSAGTSSLWATSALTPLSGRAGDVPKPLGLAATDDVVFGINITWLFPGDSGDTLSTELQYSTTADGTNPMLLAAVPYPQHIYQQMGLRTGQRFWYRARLVDRIGNQSDWTGWVEGISSINLDDVQQVVDDSIRNSDAFNELSEELSGQGIKLDDLADKVNQTASQASDSAIAALENALANNGTVDRQFAQYGENKAAITQVKTTVATQGQAIAGLETTLSSTVNDFNAQIKQIEGTIADTVDGAISTLETELSATAGELETVKSNVDEVRTAAADNESAIATVRDDLTSQVEDASGRISTIENTQSSQGQAIAQAQSDIQSNYEALSGRVQTISTSQASDHEALGSLETQVTATDQQVKDVSAAVNQKLTAEFTGSGASATYSLRVGVNDNGTYHGAGMAIGYNSGKSTIAFAADQFGIYTGSDPANYKLAFSVTAGQVYINDTLIRDASITNAKIGSFIQSTNYVTGSAGWRIDKNGKAEFSNAVVRGTIYATDGEFNGTVNATDGEFRGTVYATDGEFNGTVYANKIVGNISESRIYPSFTKMASSDATLNINYAGNSRLPVRVSIFFTINEYTAGARFFVGGVEQTDRSAGKSFGFSYDLAVGEKKTITLSAGGGGRLSTSPIIAIVTPQGTGLS